MYLMLVEYWFNALMYEPERIASSNIVSLNYLG